MVKFKVKVGFAPHRLNFKFDAGTSRGVLRQKTSYIIRLTSDSFPGAIGYGEAGPLPGLSIDLVEDLEVIIEQYRGLFDKQVFTADADQLMQELREVISNEHPSVRFAFETAFLDLIHGGKKQLFPELPLEDLQHQAINGLIWMGDPDFMLKQIDQKLQEGYNCIKMKIGAIDFEQECRLLRHIREHFSAEQITLRVDANGAFSVMEALDKLEKLAIYQVHSIEQPIRQGDWATMAKLCRISPVPIALDEELIGVYGESKRELLQEIQPPFIILKPTLLGGIQDTREWIDLAEEMGIGWWMTSALESNIGLNAIYQYTNLYRPELPQGLGTGQLYTNNIGSPLTISQGQLYYDTQQDWEDLETLFQ